jgi:hypothetical protein
MKTTVCPKCNISIKNCNFKKHNSVCNGNYTPFIKASVCKFCSIELEQFSTANRANHVRWCDKNPKRSEYAINNNCSQMHFPEIVSKRNKSIKQAWTDGKYNGVNHSHPGWNHSEKTIEHLRQKALASPHRRLVRSIREYTKKDGTIVKLDSSWEEALAKRLDLTNVDWIRPDPIKWIDRNGVSHHYFPDFYLPLYDLYLDPKGPYAFKSQSDKISCLTEQIKNLIIITSLEECKKFVPTK